MLWAIRTDLPPGRLVDVGETPRDEIIVECPLDPDHIRGLRDWSVVNYIEPAAPQRRMVEGVDLLACINSASLLVSARLREAMRAAGLTGWTDIPAPIRMRDGSLREGYHELRITGFCGVPGPVSGLRLLSICPGCGYRRYAPGFRYDLALRDLPRARPDFLSIWPMVGRILCSDRARQVIAGFDCDAVQFVDAESLVKPLRPGDAEPPPFLSDAARAEIEAFRSAPTPG